MSWIDDRISDMKLLEDHQREVSARKALIAEQAETIYGELWSELKAVLNDFTAKGLVSFLNGSPLDRVVRRSGKIKPGMSHHPGYEFHVKLSKDRQSIAIAGDVTMNLQLDFGEDDVICIKTLGESVSYRDAANRILDKFFFPELQPPAP